MNRWLIWTFKRLIVPITWYASAVFIIRVQAPGPVTEFALGAAVLLGWAILADWPGGRFRADGGAAD